MKIADIITLKKAGYTVGEIKEIENADTVIELLNNGFDKEEIADYIGLVSVAEDNPPTDDDKPDYEKLYNELKTKEQKREQEEAIHEDIEKDIETDDRSDYEKLRDIVKETIFS